MVPILIFLNWNTGDDEKLPPSQVDQVYAENKLSFCRSQDKNDNTDLVHSSHPVSQTLYWAGLTGDNRLLPPWGAAAHRKEAHHPPSYSRCVSILPPSEGDINLVSYPQAELLCTFLFSYYPDQKIYDVSLPKTTAVLHIQLSFIWIYNQALVFSVRHWFATTSSNIYVCNNTTPHGSYSIAASLQNHCTTL